MSTPTPEFQRGEGENALAWGEATDVNEAEMDFTPQDPAEQFIYSETDRPQEPITAGAPFGPGADVTTTVYDDEMFLSRAANQLATAPYRSSEVNAFLDRLSEGL